MMNQNSIPPADAYWISPEGDIISVGKSHIRTILNDPSVFNLEKEYIYDLYKHYNEKIGLEGKAREDILVEVISKGWIRMRFYKKEYS